MKRKGLVDDVAGRIAIGKPGYKPWHTRLPPDVQKELAEVKAQFRAGLLTPSKHALARAVAEAIEGRGLPRPGVQAVVAWLKAD